MKAHILSLLYYPFRLTNAKWFSDWQYYREQVKPTACQHKRTRLLTANLKTLTIRKQCFYCQEIIEINFNEAA